MVYNIEFIGRKAGAIGIVYKITDKIEIGANKNS